MVSRRQDLVIKTSAVSFTFKDFRPDFIRWTEGQKRRAMWSAREIMTEWSIRVARLAKMYCPEYSGELSEHIKAAATHAIGAMRPGGGGRIEGSVGIEKGWHSPFDEDYQKNQNSPPPWGVSSDQLALFLHEFWDEVADEGGRDRAADKGARFGVRVGERFLSRAADDTTADVRQVARAIFSEKLAYRDGYAIPGNVLGDEPINPVRYDVSKMGAPDQMEDAPF